MGLCLVSYEWHVVVFRDVLDSKQLLGSFQQRFYIDFVLVAAIVHSVA
jgi:hypothetical protein